MFSKILIANRGEIACRIIKTSRRMGIGTVAVYSEVDRDALHVELADEAVAIGPSPAAQSYLVAERIVDACRRTGADAVHPGYGFLSEQAAFAEALAAAGIAFIGPNPRAIRSMGDKITSKTFAAAAGVSTVPGHAGVVEAAADAVRIAAAIGYPVMIKASAGGGGKGMRIAHNDAEAREGFERARSEAASSFGDDRLFVEKFITDPRHIEIQVLGDRHGNVIHLGERECSIQRRNQKVLEEAPSPLLDEATRRLMGEQAVALARAVGYDSAGTVEFVSGQDRSFFFLEMNTRLQVEHPVTELVTGLDLVEEMIRVAAGEPLRIAQADVVLTGWAIESRIYAEDPTRGFLPSTGRVTTYRPPREGTEAGITVRVDTGLAEGGEVSVFYDPMVAKLVTHAPTRSLAVAAQARALDSFAIDGIRHNIPFLATLMTHRRWREGRLSTAFIAEEFPHGFGNLQPDGAAARRFAAVAAAIDHLLNQRKRGISGQLRAARPVAFDATRVALVGSQRFAFTILTTGGGALLKFDDGTMTEVRSTWRPGAPVWSGTIDGATVAFQVRPRSNGVVLIHGGAVAEVHVYTAREAELAALMPVKPVGDGGRVVLCPMPGLVTAIRVAVGQEVKIGEPLAVMEAMKMENVLLAERDGVIASIGAKPGDSVAVDAVLFEFA